MSVAFGSWASFACWAGFLLANFLFLDYHLPLPCTCLSSFSFSVSYWPSSNWNDVAEECFHMWTNLKLLQHCGLSDMTNHRGTMRRVTVLSLVQKWCSCKVNTIKMRSLKPWAIISQLDMPTSMLAWNHVQHHLTCRSRFTKYHNNLI